jgi:hypothetical protein
MQKYTNNVNLADEQMIKFATAVAVEITGEDVNDFLDEDAFNAEVKRVLAGAESSCSDPEGDDSNVSYTRRYHDASTGLTTLIDAQWVKGQPRVTAYIMKFENGFATYAV